MKPTRSQSVTAQAVTIILWTMARFFLYASYFTIFGVLFGFKNFGKMVAVDNVVNGLFGALRVLGLRASNPMSGPLSAFMLSWSWRLLCVARHGNSC